jgi:hypothetical protein
MLALQARPRSSPAARIRSNGMDQAQVTEC